MKLVFIKKIGQNWKGNYIYEFLFSEIIKDIDGEGWDHPSSSNPEPPEEKYIKKTGIKMKGTPSPSKLKIV